MTNEETREFLKELIDNLNEKHADNAESIKIILNKLEKILVNQENHNVRIQTIEKEKSQVSSKVFAIIMSLPAILISLIATIKSFVK